MCGAEERQPDRSDGAGRQLHQRVAAPAGLRDAPRLAQAQPQIRRRVGAARAGAPAGCVATKGKGEGALWLAAARVSSKKNKIKK